MDSRRFIILFPQVLVFTLWNLWLLAGQLSEFYREILSDHISAYRKFHSCETSLLRLTEDWRMMRDRGELVAVVSMGLSKAFDVIQYPLLLSKLKAYGMDDTSCTLLREISEN